MKNLILQKNIIGISIFVTSLLFIFIFGDSFVCEYGEGLYGRFCPIEKDSLMEIKFGIGIILIHLLVIFTRLSPFYRRVYSDSSFVFIFIVLSIISTILLFALLNTQIKDHDGGGPLGGLTLFHIIAVPLSFISFILYTFVYSILKKNIYSILFYGIIGGLYYLAETTKSETVTIIGFGIILIGIYYVIFHLLLYLFDNKDFRE